MVYSKDLDQDQAYEVASDIMKGSATQAQISAFLTGLRIKGETIEEIIGFVRAMREFATTIPCACTDVIDTCGTGGDRLNTFNISTVSALVAAGSGCAVAKHGNRSVSSTCGSADVLEGLGVCIELAPEQIAACIDKIGIGFLYAPLLHTAMKHAIGPRREIGVRTIFNVLGPLTNPAGAKRQLIGVFDRELTNPIAHVLKSLGTQHAMVVHGNDGLDEITISGSTFVSELRNGGVRDYLIDPEDFGIPRQSLEHIQVKNLEQSIASVQEVLMDRNGPKKDIVLLNAGAAIYVSGRAGTLEQGIASARSSIENGQALGRLHALQEGTNQ
jgi:anthranilate phosphoribosyltransferase